MPVTTASRIADIPADQICVNHNIRFELGLDDDFVESIRAQGILVRCTVSTGPCGCDLELPFRMDAGHRRHGAAVRSFGAKAPIPSEIVDQGLAEHTVTMLVENLQRRNLDPVDEGQGYVELVALGWSQAAIGASVGKSDAHISERILLTTLPEAAVSALRADKIVLADALALARTKDETVVGLALTQLERQGWARPSWQSMADYIKRIREDVAKRAAQKKKLDELKAKGVKCGKSSPAGAASVRPKGSTHGYGRALDETVAQFLKRDDAFVTVGLGYSGIDVSYHLLAKRPEKKAETNGQVETTPKPADGSNISAQLADQGRIADHRTEWLATWVRKGKMAAAQAVPLALTALIDDYVDHGYVVEVVNLLGLEPTLDDSREDLVRKWLASAGVAEMARLIYAVLLTVEEKVDDGIYARRIPAVLGNIGYEAHELEKGWPLEA